MTYESFDVIEYLDDRGIAYVTEGKNVSRGWIEVNCPFCPDGDPSEHLGINLETKGISCWRCPTRGTILKYIMRIDRCNLAAAKEICSRFQDMTLGSTRKREPPSMKHLILPPEASYKFPLMHRNWLTARNFQVEEVIKKYDLMAVNMLGDWAFRIIIPVYQHHKLVTFTSRDVSEQAEFAHRACSTEESLIPIKHCLYNIDTVRDTAIVVEGVADVWRIGDGAVATFGIAWTKEQVALLTGLKNVYVMFDAEPLALESAYEFAHAVSSVARTVKVIKLSTGDPADLTQDAVVRLRREIFGR